MRFTQAQSEAISAQNRELLVSAAAGSGKTAVLVERILQMVEKRGMSIDRMLIVTFTRAAAAEMRERLELRLTQAAQNDQTLQRQADLVSAAQISTIHAFCKKVVSQNFQHCEIDPQFALLDESERTALYREAMEQTLDELYERKADDENLRALTDKFQERDIILMMDTLYRFLMSRPSPMEWLDMYANKQWRLETLDDEPMSKAFCAEAELVIQGMRTLWQETREMAGEPNFPPPYAKTLQADGQTIGELKDACANGFISLLSCLGSLKFAVLSRFKAETDDELAMAEAYKETRGRYKDMADELKKMLVVDPAQGVSDMAAMSGATQGLATAVKAFHEHFTLAKRERGALDFNDLEHMTLDVLHEEALRREQSERFDAIFVDEYQDVSALQESILNALKPNPADGRDQFFFYVGDVKQSIYRFRLAEPALFLSKQQTFGTDREAPLRKIILNRNFRSRVGVLNAVNRVFAHVMDSRVTEIDYDADARLYPGVESMRDPQTELHILNSTGKKSADMVLAEAELIARDISQTIGSVLYDGEGNECGILRYRDIAILMPVSKNISDKVELVLSRAGIPVYCENSGDSMRSEEITQVLEHLVLMDNVMSDVPLISELRSPLFEMTESELAQIRLAKPQREASFLAALRAQAECDSALGRRCAQAIEQLKRERFLYQHMALDEYIWDFLMRSGLYAHYGAQPGGKLRQANLRLICHKAGEYIKTHSDGLHGFLETIKLAADTGGSGSPTVINPWENVVRVMTIHKSKGLEFPTVYLMGMGGALRRRTSTRMVSAHGAIGFGLSYVNEKARTRRPTLIQGAIDLKERNEERAERARVLYVAMTRPKSRLVMIGSSGEKALNYADTLATLKAGANSDVFAVRSARSMLEWVAQCVRRGDLLEDWEQDELSTEHMREMQMTTELTTEPTSFPHKEGVWRVVFHNAPVISKHTQVGENVKLQIPDASAADCMQSEPNAGAIADPVAPALSFVNRPLKLGVTALCRALEESKTLASAQPQDEDSERETAEQKRYPMELARPKLLGSLPQAPAFLLPPKEELALQKGVQTHRLLGLLPLAGIAQQASDEKRLTAFVRGEVARLVEEGVIQATEAKLIDQKMAVRFLGSELGARMLRSERVMREWSFNLRIKEPLDTILQGVIDLCFLEDGAWVLTDFKTDRVKRARDLWQRYGTQMHFYEMALQRATPYPVKESILYSLLLGESCDKNEKDLEM